MSLPQDIYTPWKDDPEGLVARHVDREAELAALVGALRLFAQGGRPLPLYLYGPRGFGKSHLLALARYKAGDDLRLGAVQIHVVSEDIPAQHRARDMVSRFEESDLPAWMRLSIPTAPTGARRVLFVEALEKHLAKMEEPEQRALRAWLSERPEVLLVATGITMPAAFGREGAFYGFFDPFPIQPMEPAQAELLLDRLVPEGLLHASHWERRRRALVALAGGSPRTLGALGHACAHQPEALASDHLLSVVRTFTAHYQMRFADLSVQEQTIIEQLALAPRELSPTELGIAMERGASHASQVARRLEVAGVLLSRSEGRSTWYRLAEPLFRHWYEYRTAPWDQARASLVGRLLEAVLSPEELVAAWWDNPDAEVRRAAGEALGRDWDRLWAAWQRVLDELNPQQVPNDLARRRELLGRAADLPIEPFMVALMARRIQSWSQWDIADDARPLLDRAGLEVILATWDFRAEVERRSAPRDAFRRLVPRLLRLAGQGKPREYLAHMMWSIALDAVLDTLRRVEQRGKPWCLGRQERTQLSRLPAFRAAFLLRGKRSGDDPLLDPGDLIGIGLGSVQPDAAVLLAATARRRDPALFEMVVRALEQEGLSPWAFPAAPEPRRACPSASGVLASLLTRALTSQLAPSGLRLTVLTWSASFASLDEEAWRALLTAIASQAASDKLEPGQLLSAVEAGLVALGVARMERLEQLAVHLPPTDPLQPVILRARALALQLLQRSEARLHPELELVWQELGLDS